VATCLYCFYSEAKNQHFCPTGVTRCTDSCETWHGWAACWSTQPGEISPQSLHMGVYVVPKKSKFSNFGKDSPRVGKHLDQILQMLGAFICPTTLLNLTWFATQVTDLLQRKRASVVCPEFFSAPCRKNMH